MQLFMSDYITDNDTIIIIHDMIQVYVQHYRAVQKNRNGHCGTSAEIQTREQIDLDCDGLCNKVP